MQACWKQKLMELCSLGENALNLPYQNICYTSISCYRALFWSMQSDGMCYYCIQPLLTVIMHTQVHSQSYIHGQWSSEAQVFMSSNQTPSGPKMPRYKEEFSHNSAMHCYDSCINCSIQVCYPWHFMLD